MTPLADLSDAQLRARRTVKWTVPDDVLPVWVAETDFALAPEVAEGVARALRDESTGYAPADSATGLPEAVVAHAATAWAWDVSPARVVLTGDVMAGVLLILNTLCDNAPVVVPTPAYPPFLEVVPLSGRQRVDVPLDPASPTACLDLDRIDEALAAGARTVLLCQPHNPWGRVFSRAELEGLRDVVTRHGARVISDEIHAPLVLPGATHVPYLAVEGTADHGVAVLSASKAWNVPGLKCAQVVTGSEVDADALRAVPLIANHGVSTLGIAANLAAWSAGGPWLLSLLERLDDNRALVRELVAEHLPRTRARSLEATYLAWLDTRAYGHDDPAAVALERGRVMVNEGTSFGAGGTGGVRLNIATSPQRLSEAVRRLAAAWEHPQAQTS